MSEPSNCCNPCAEIETVNVPGVQGDDGTNGTDGTNGGNAYTITTESEGLPNVGFDEQLSVADTSWMVPGEPIFVENWGIVIVVSVDNSTTVTVENPGYSINAAGGTMCGAGAGVTPSGSEPDVTGFATAGANSNITSLSGLTTPLSVAQGGTGLAAPIEPVAAYAAGTGYIYTATQAALNFATTDPSITILTAGFYQLTARVRSDVGVLTEITADRTLTLKMRNTTAAADIADSSSGAILPRHALGTARTIDQRTLPVVFAQLAANDVVTIFGALDSLTGVAGDVFAQQADIEAVWLHA